MTFRRSPSALFSMHIFFRADVIVFCEGGTSLTYEDAFDTVEQNNTLDILYWRSVVDTYETGKIFHFKSVGSKSILNQISDDVEDMGIKTITICRDSDYDRILGRCSSAQRIAWTMGYSWENDVVRLPILRGLITTLIGSGAASDSIVVDLQDKITKLENDLSYWTEIDISLLSLGKIALFERSRPLSVIDMSAIPNLNIIALRKRLAAAGYRRKPRTVINIPPRDVTVKCFGKFISKIIYHIITMMLKPHLKAKIEYDLFMRLAIRETIMGIRAGFLPDLSLHIENQKSAFS